jgi:hypothetical protein
MLENFELNGIQYKLQPRYCNKENCKCHDGNPHGPYWYAYSWQGTKYIGKELPAAILQQLENIKALTPTAQDEIDKLDTKINLLRHQMTAAQRIRSSLIQAINGSNLTSDDIENLKLFNLEGMTNQELI